MKQMNKHKEIKTVPLLCWDIYVEHLDTLLGRDKIFGKGKNYLSSKK